MQNNLKFSVVIPCYNSEKFISRSMLSVLNQNYKNVELIIVNDGSQDNSEEVVMDIIKDFPLRDIKYKKIQNSGPSTARNVGLSLATGEYVCFLDSDDEYGLELFEKLNNKIQGEDICFFEFVDIGVDGKVKSKYSEHYPEFHDANGVDAAKAKINGKMWICNCNAVYKLNMLKDNNISYPEGIFSGEDACFIYTSLLYAKDVTYLAYEGFICYIRDDSLMHAPITPRFMTIVDSIYELIRRVENNNNLIDVDKQYFINVFNSQLYFLNITIGKKIAHCLSEKEYIEFKKQIKEYHVESNIKYRDVKKQFNLKDKIQIYLFNISKFAFFWVVKLYDNR